MTKISWQWLVAGACVVVVGGWLMKSKQSTVGINEVSSTAMESLIGKWEFDDDADMGATGWVVKRLVAGRSATVLGTTLVDGWMVVSGTVGSEVAVVKSQQLSLPEVMGDLTVKVVASAAVQPAASPKSTKGVTLPTPTLKGRFQVGRDQAVVAELVATDEPEVAGTDMVYSFRIPASVLSKPGMKKLLGEKEILIFLSATDIKMTEVKIDSITITTNPASGTNPSKAGETVTLVGTLRSGGSAKVATCQLTLANEEKTQYSVIYTKQTVLSGGVSASANPKVGSGCPAPLLPYLRVPVEVVGTMVGQKSLELKSVTVID